MTAVWDRRYMPGRPGYQLLTARRLTGGGWSTPTRLAESHEDEAEVWTLRLAENAAGQAVVAWEDDVGRILAVTRSSSGRWSPPSHLGLGASPVAAISATGVATVAFEGNGVQLLQHDGRGWVRAAPAPGPIGRQVALDARPGDVAVVMWLSGKIYNPRNAYPPPPRPPASGVYTTARYDGRWRGVAQLARGLEDTSDEHVVAGSDGSAFFTWTTGKGTACGEVRSVYQPSAGKPATVPQAIATGTNGPCARKHAYAVPVAAADAADGQAVLAWFAHRTEQAVHVASRGAGDAQWSLPEVIRAGQPKERLQEVVAAMGDDGSALIGWIVRGGVASAEESASGLWVQRRAPLP